MFCIAANQTPTYQEEECPQQTNGNSVIITSHWCKSFFNFIPWETNAVILIEYRSRTSQKSESFILEILYRMSRKNLTFQISQKLVQ